MVEKNLKHAVKNNWLFQPINTGCLESIVRLSEKRPDTNQGAYSSNLLWENQLLMHGEKKRCCLCWRKATQIKRGKSVLVQTAQFKNVDKLKQGECEEIKRGSN